MQQQTKREMLKLRECTAGETRGVRYLVATRTESDSGAEGTCVIALVPDGLGHGPVPRRQSG